jgi:hypothetical protein
LDIGGWGREIKPASVGLSTALAFKSKFLGIVCPDLTNCLDKILSKTSREVFYE